jgi:hypothetical protein
MGIRVIALLGFAAVACSKDAIDDPRNEGLADMAVASETTDMASAPKGPSDLAGVFCNDKYCYGGNKCCGVFDRKADLGTSFCGTPECNFAVDAGENIRQRSLECDGPEECSGGQNCCVALGNISGKTQYSNVVCGAAPRDLPANMNDAPNPTCTPYIVGTSNGDTRLCHTNADCTTGTGPVPSGAMPLNNCCSGTLFGITASFCFTNNPLILGALAGKGYLVTCQ